MDVLIGLKIAVRLRKTGKKDWKLIKLKENNTRNCMKLE